MIDDTGRKIFAQLDATLPGERVNALEHLVAHLAKQNPPMTFRQLAADLAGAVPAQKFAELEAKLQATEASLQQYQQANSQAQAVHMAQQSENARLRAALQRAQAGRSVFFRAWSYLIGQPRALAAIGVVALVIAAGVGAYRAMQPAAEPEMSAVAREQLAAQVRSTQWSSGRFGPAVRTLDGDPWWVVLIGDDDGSSFANKTGDAVTLHCFHYFARPAKAAFGNFLKPASDADWQERGRECRDTRTATR
jgi:hypothetical protein